METRLDTLYRLQEQDLSTAGCVLADAFQRDPLWTRVFERVADDVHRMGPWYESPVRFCHTYGEVYAPSERLEGVAAWVPGDLADMTFWRMIRSGAMRSAMRMGLRMAWHAQKMRPLFASIEADRKANTRGRSYIYLMVIGVATQFQGRGFGGKLLRALIEESERAAVPVYLETETERNVSMYERLGFSALKRLTLPVIDLPMWEMIREPSAV